MSISVRDPSVSSKAVPSVFQWGLLCCGTNSNPPVNSMSSFDHICVARLWLRARILRATILFTHFHKRKSELSVGQVQLTDWNLRMWIEIVCGTVVWNGGHLDVCLFAPSTPIFTCLPRDNHRVKHVQALFLWACVWGSLYFLHQEVSINHFKET